MSKSLGGLIFGKSKNTTATIDVNDKEVKTKIDALLQKIKECNTTVEIGVAVDEAGLAEVDGLKQHINELHAKGQLDSFGKDDVGKFIENQNLTNIAKQAHGLVGVNTAINQYKFLVDRADGSAEKFADTIGKGNINLGNYLKGLNGAKGGIVGYGISLVGATAKTIALEAATMALNMALSAGISYLLQAGITALDNWIHKEEKAAEAAQELADKSREKVEELEAEQDQITSLIDEYERLASAESVDATSRERIGEIQKEITKLVGGEVEGLDLVNGKLEDQLKLHIYILTLIYMMQYTQHLIQALDHFVQRQYLNYFL